MSNPDKIRIISDEALDPQLPEAILAAGSYHLKDKKDICPNISDHLLLATLSIPIGNDSPELHTFVRAEIEKQGENRLASRIPDKFNLTEYVLVV